MQIQPASEIVAALLICSVLAICVEAVVELWLTAGPLERARAYVARTFTESKRYSWIPELTTCGYCMSVWIAGIAALVPGPIVSSSLFGWFINLLLIHRLANLFHNRVMKKSMTLEPYNAESNNEQ